MTGVNRSFTEETGAGIRLVRGDSPLAGVDTGEADAAVVRGDVPEGAKVRARRLSGERRVAAVARSAPLAARRVLDWAELAGHPLVVNTVTGTARPELWPPEARPQVRCTAGNVDEWVEAIAAGHGVGVAPEAVRRHAHPGVRYIRLKNAPEVPVHVVTPLDGAHPLAVRYAAAAERLLTAPGR
ncbi:substrate-binding domain-containing protein [Nocardiopsis composta]|uniref:substrate-binding domain-containing protein n=1 Tax=Nocardiopsis composta TaxID=157465 RepID=UPI003382473B